MWAESADKKHPWAKLYIDQLTHLGNMWGKHESGTGMNQQISLIRNNGT